MRATRCRSSSRSDPVPPTRAELRELIGAAADRALTHPYKLWGYGEGPALRGVLRAAGTLRRPALVDAVADLVAPTLTAPADEEVDHLIPVEVLARLRRLCPVIDVAGAVDRFVRAVAGASRPVPGRPPVHRPHHPTLGRLIWVDCLHTDGPGLALAGRRADAVRVTTEAAQVLQDETGLFSHGYRVDTGTPNGVHWARGQGWALYGLGGMPEHAERVARLLTALTEHEVDGRWHTVVDDPASPVEASLSPMVAASAATLGARWRGLADRALAATLADVRPDGTLPVSAATPVGEAPSYALPHTGAYPWGQGPLLDALHVAWEATE